MTRGLLCVATHGGGLIGVDPERAAITWVVTVAEGLPSDLLYGCCSDGQGQLWLGTRRGVARHTVRTGRCVVVGILLIMVNPRGWSCQTCCAGRRSTRRRPPRAARRAAWGCRRRGRWRQWR